MTKWWYVVWLYCGWHKNATNLNEFVGVIMKQLRELIHLLLISRLRCFNQHQQRHARLQEQVTHVVHHCSVKLQQHHSHYQPSHSEQMSWLAWHITSYFISSNLLTGAKLSLLNQSTWLMLTNLNVTRTKNDTKTPENPKRLYSI